MIILPKARYEWSQLRLHEFKSVSDYNYMMHRIVSTLRLCGDTVTEDEMLERTLSTFHAANMVLQQQYRKHGFTTYSELLYSLLLAEENNQLHMNHQSRPIDLAPPPDQSQANVVSSGRGTNIANDDFFEEFENNHLDIVDNLPPGEDGEPLFDDNPNDLALKKDGNC